MGLRRQFAAVRRFARMPVDESAQRPAGLSREILGAVRGHRVDFTTTRSGGMLVRSPRHPMSRVVADVTAVLGL